MRRLRSFHLIVPLLCLFFITNVRGDVGSSIRGSGGGASVSANNDWTGTNNFTSTVSVYQTTTHSGNNWLGLAHDGTNGVVSTGAGDVTFKFTNTQYAFLRGNPGRITINDNAGINPVILTRGGAASLQMGTDVNGAAVAQIFSAHKGITGTDIAGASLTLAPGTGTGAAVSGSLILNRDLVGATGTTSQTQAPSYISCPTKILSNTSATVQTMATITTTSTTGGSIKMFFTVVANNGTLQDTDAGEIIIGWNNNAGTVAAAASAVYGQMDSDASGTLATTPTVTFATNVVSVKFTPTWVTIVPTTVTGFATFEVNGVNTVACQ